jgi:DNA-binding NarL/FixJ family response regulator
MQKVVAVERGRSQATISGHLKRQLKRMGVEQCTRRLPLALALLAHATDSELVEVTLTGSTEVAGACASWRLVAELSEVSLTDLSPGERDVTRRYLEGQTHAQIACARASKPRTVANQLASVFQRYGATGRFDLLRAILERGRCLGARSTLHVHRGDDQRSPATAHAA